MKKAVRLITFSNFDAHAEPLFKSLNILNLSNTIDLNLGKFMWEVNTKALPKSLLVSEFDQEKKSNRNITHSFKYIPTCRTKYKSSFTTTSGTILWMKLPEKIKEVKSKRLFTKHLKIHLINS